MTGLLQHLLESTLFAGAVWLTTLALRRNHARTRHALWMAASLKFLVPFSLFVACGSLITRPPAPPAPPPQMRFVMVDAAPAVPPGQPVPIATPVRRDWRPPVFLLIWLFGCAGILVRWYRRWRDASLLLRESAALARWDLPVPARSSASVLEPGVFGIFGPVLVLPADIEVHLSAEQLQAVVAHELCHIRHRDNLTAAIHMAVEALFWFHPLIWWMGARLVDERERACDEEVLQQGSDRAVYAESILRVCRLYLESPLPCVSGITGADLKQRIRNIMSASVRYQLEPAKKLMLATMAAAAVAVPLAVGLTHPASLRAQEAQTAPAMQFDVASVKLAADQSILESRPKRSTGRFRWKTQLIYLINYAYNIEWWRISGDKVAFGTIYELDATHDPKATDDQVRLMLQSLLLDRFKMAAHRVTKEADGYALTVAKGGPKMQEAKEGEVPPMPEWMRRPSDDPAKMEGLVVATLPLKGVGAITARRITMLQFTTQLQRLLDAAVLDQTGLDGKYYFGLRYATTDSPEIPYPDLFSAVKDLGLRLEKHKGPVETLVVDRIEKLPTEN